MEQKLKDILENMNSWLKFAENKNAAIIAFNSAVLFGIVSILIQVTVIPRVIRYYLCFAVLMLGFGIISSLLSFLPQLRLPWFFTRALADEKDNLLYFGHAARYTPDSYVKTFSKVLKRKVDQTTPLEKWYAEQIVMNSRIAMYKYRWFMVALWFTIAAFATPITPIIGLVIYLLDRKEGR